MKDVVIGKILASESLRQKETLNLIASENFVSGDVLVALGSVFTNKYAEGYPGARYYGGNRYVDDIERVCMERALSLFKLSEDQWHVNVQPYSGSPANLAVYTALVPLGEKIMGLRLDMGGHLTHGHVASVTGKAWSAVSYSLDPITEMIDYSAVLMLAKKERPKLLIAGFTAYSRTVDYMKFREIANEVGAFFMVDISHIAGLVAGGVLPTPFLTADVVTTTTHKTLRGPRGAVIFSRKSLSKKIDRAVFPGLQGGPHMNQVAGMAVAFKEASSSSFRHYAKRTIQNASVLSEELAARGFRIVSRGTDTHLFVVDVSSQGVTGGEAGAMLEASNIVVNKNTIPFDQRSPMDPSGIRIGTPAVTTRGMGEKEMKEIADYISLVIIEKKNVAKKVKALTKRFPVPAF